MAWTPVDSRTAAFANGGSGYVFDLGASPQAGDIDVVFVNSDTTVSTPSGWTLPTNGSHVGNQGAYAFYRKATGGEGSTVTITTAGNFNAVAGWSRWRGGNAFETAVKATADGSTGGTTPAVSIGPLTQTGELVIAGACLHRLASPEPASPVWSSGFTGLTAVTQGTGNPGVVQFVGYKTGAGTSAESPNVTWTNGAFDRYIIVLAFTGITSIDLSRATETDTARTLTASKTAIIGRATETGTAQPLTTSKQVSLGRSAGTDLARPLTLVRVVQLGQVTETGTARPLTLTKTLGLGQAVETDVAHPLVLAGPDGGPGVLTPSVTAVSTLTATTTP